MNAPSAPADAAAPRALDRIRIVLVATSHPGNIGAAARAMLTMGLARLVLVAPARFPAPDAVARASGATAVLDAARVVATLDEALAGCALSIGLTARPREFAGRVADARGAAREAVARSAEGDVALVFGTEMSGLSNAELARCGLAATIPANPAFSSLNLAAADAGDGLRAARRRRRGDRLARAALRGRHRRRDRGLHRHARATLLAARFLDAERPRRLLARLRQLFGRAQLTNARR